LPKLLQKVGLQMVPLAKVEQHILNHRQRGGVAKMLWIFAQAQANSTQFVQAEMGVYQITQVHQEHMVGLGWQ
jgi:hypothetical protein